MAKVRVVRTIRMGSQRVAVKKVPSLANVVVRSTVEATTTQIRVLAEESRELLLDRLFAGVPQPPGRVKVARPRRVVPSMPGAARIAFRHRLLTRRTVARKVSLALDGRKLIETGNYARGIEVFRGQQESGVYYMVRVADRPHKGFDPSSGPIRLGVLARLHEFGSARLRIPARPHWRPTVRDVMARFRELKRTIRAAGLREALREIG